MNMFLAVKAAIESAFGFIATNIMELFGYPPLYEVDYGMTFDAIFAAIKTMLGF